MRQNSRVDVKLGCEAWVGSQPVSLVMTRGE